MKTHRLIGLKPFIKELDPDERNLLKSFIGKEIELIDNDNLGARLFIMPDNEPASEVFLIVEQLPTTEEAEYERQGFVFDQAHIKEDADAWETAVSKPNIYDFINPSHYKKFSVEVIDMMVAIWGKEKTAVFCEISAFGYRMRMGEKPDQSIERELEKEKWFLNKVKELRS